MKLNKEKVPRDTYKIFKNNLKTFNVSNRVIPLLSSSRRAAKNWNKKSKIGLLWIDGEHQYEYVLEDILRWEKHLVKGGLMLFHDSEKSKNKVKATNEIIIKNPGVEKAIRRFVNERFKKLRVVDAISVFKKIEKAGQIEEFINKLRLILNEIKLLPPVFYLAGIIHRQQLRILKRT